MDQVDGRALELRELDMYEYWPQVIGASIALVGAGVGALIQHCLAQKQFRAQQQWAAREKHYMELLGHLSKARVNLTELCEYFIEPDSEYADYSKDARFKRLSQSVHGSLAAIKESVGPARVFLSKEAIKAFEDLERKEWNAGMDAVHVSEYVEAVAQLVEKAESKVIAAAQAHLGS